MDRVRTHLWLNIWDAAPTPPKKKTGQGLSEFRRCNDQNSGYFGIVDKANVYTVLAARFVLKKVKPRTAHVLQWAAKQCIRPLCQSQLGMCTFIFAWECPRDQGLSLVRANRVKALRCAAARGNIDIIQLFKNIGLTRQDVRRCEVLKTAAKHGQLDTLKFLMETWSLKLKDVQVHENMALSYAANSGHVHVIQYFKDLGLTLKDVRDAHNRALRCAASYGHVNVLKFLKNWRDATDAEPLETETSGDQKKEDKLTVQDVRANNNQALLWAAEGNHMDVCVFLSEWLCQSDAVADEFWALRHAVRNGNLDMCKFFVDWSGVTQINNIDALFEDAVERGYLDVCKWLRQCDSKMSGESLLSNLTLNVVRAGRAFEFAAENGHVHILQYLKNWRSICSVNEKDQHGALGIPSDSSENSESGYLALKDVTLYVNKAFEEAAKYGHVHVLQFLIDWWEDDQRNALENNKAHGINESILTIGDAQLSYMLYWAAYYGHLNVLQFLKNWSDKPEVWQNNKSEIWQNNKPWPWSRHLTVNDIRPQKHENYLGTAARRGHLHILHFFKDWKTQKSDGTWDQLTPEDIRFDNNFAFHQAAAVGHLEVCKFLKEWGQLTIKDVRAKNNAAFQYAAENGHVHILQFLKDWRDVSHPGRTDAERLRDGRSAIEKDGRTDAERLRDDRLETETINKTGTTLDKSETQLTLVDVRAVINVNDSYTLQNVAGNGHVHVFQFLKDWRDDCSAVGKNGVCAQFLTVKDIQANYKVIQHAAEYCQLEVLKFLRDWRCSNNNGATSPGFTMKDAKACHNAAIVLAARRGHLEVLEMFKDSWGMTLADIRDYKNDALQEAVVGGHLHVLQFFKDCGMTLRDVRCQRNLALKKAARYGYLDILKFFKKWGLTRADVRMDNCAPLRIARMYQSCNSDVCQFLEKWGGALPKKYDKWNPPKKGACRFYRLF